jgi:ankyrin repeat/SAM/basic leucine zipper domain-containing protein 1
VLVYGELELFLAGLDLAHLIPVFRQQLVSFQTFLRLTDVDLMRIGISEIGVRKKILDAVRETHKKNWEASSLASVQYHKRISCSEAVVMLANIKKHAAYIASTIGYIDDQVLADNKIVLDAPQDAGIGAKDLCINTEEAMVNVRNLYVELSSLRKHLEKICHNRDFLPPELITPRRKRRNRRWRYAWRRLALFGVFVAGCTTAFVLFGKNSRH